MTYSYDLRLKALEYLKRGDSKTEASKIFGVTPRTLLNWTKREERGCLAPSKRDCTSYKIEEEKLKVYLEKHPDDYLREIAKAFGVSIGAIFYACKRLKITLKKRHLSIKKGVKPKEKHFKKS